MAIPDKQETPRPLGTDPIIELQAGAETVYTDSSFKVVGSLLQTLSMILILGGYVE